MPARSIAHIVSNIRKTLGYLRWYQSSNMYAAYQSVINRLHYISTIREHSTPQSNSEIRSIDYSSQGKILFEQKKFWFFFFLNANLPPPSGSVGVYLIYLFLILSSYYFSQISHLAVHSLRSLCRSVRTSKKQLMVSFLCSSICFSFPTSERTRLVLKGKNHIKIII